MKKRPILFNAEMVRAVLDGRKTVTRRVVKPQPILNHPYSIFLHGYTFMSADGKAVRAEWTSREPRPQGILQFCPYGSPGDRLWVRQKFRQCDRCGAVNFDNSVSAFPNNCKACDDVLGKWTPSIHMPRWASRILLEVVSVRVERVAEISEIDAKAEGVDPSDDTWAPRGFGHRSAFKLLWNAINYKRGYGWDKSPWVWVVEFKRVTP